MGLIRRYVSMLSATDEKTLDKIAELEEQKKFNEHAEDALLPYIPVDKNYEYLPKSIFKKVGYFFKRLFVVNRIKRRANKCFKTIVVGKENIKGIDNAVVCCNHVNKLDSMAICHALSPHKIYFTTAEFNNMKGFLGEMMRAGRILPMSQNIDAQKNFLKSVEELLATKNYVTFFPERAEWWCYKKPRPHEIGAYHIAKKYNVPIVPIFITFAETEASKASKTGLPQFVVNVLKPIYPNKNVGREDANIMRGKCFDEFKKCYEKFYDETLS